MLTRRDEKRLGCVDGRLVEVVRLAFALWEAEFDRGNVRLMVVEGLRSAERQAELYAQGRTAPGKIVTWTMNSKHLHGHAVDCAPVRSGVILWNDRVLFERMIDVFMRAAAQLNVPIRSGADWDGDGVRHEKGENDSPHFELVA